MSPPEITSWGAELQLELGEFQLDVAIEARSRPVALVGPNGAGKTTVLRALTGALKPMRGRIVIGDTVVLDTERGVDLPIELRRIGYMPQGAGLFPHLNAIDNVAFGITRRPVGCGGYRSECTDHRGAIVRRRDERAGRRRMVEELLAQMGVGDVACRRPAALSGGERQRVALARAVAVRPTLLLLDEPLAGVDVAARRHLRAFIARQLAAYPVARVVATHYSSDLRAFDVDIYVLEAGRVVQVGTVEQLQRSPVNDFVAELLG